MRALPDRYVSTGRLPDEGAVRRLVEEAYERFRGLSEGEPSQAYAALAGADPALFGICVASTTGATHAVGDAEVPFPIMSVSKPFTFAIACDLLGPDALRARVGVNATGQAFNSLSVLDGAEGGRTNPLVNPGAIATAGLVPGATTAERWATVRRGMSTFAGRDLDLDEALVEIARGNERNEQIAVRLDELGVLVHGPADALDVYIRQCCLDVTAVDLAVMGATLADGGVNPITGERVVSEATCRYTLSVMATAGLYETSGDWLYEIGLPGKSGIGGGIVTVSPGKGGMGTFSPRLDTVGNSVRGQRVAEFLSDRLGLDIFASAPEVQRDVGEGSGD